MLTRARSTAAAIMLTLAPCPALAQDDVDGQLWTQAVATLRPAGDWRLHLEFQPRWYQDISEPFQVITRSAVGRALGPRVTAWGGYAWIAKPPGPGTTHEQRIWEQLAISLPARGAWSTALRLRVEHRFQDNWADSSHRLRMMARVSRPLDARRLWTMTAGDEVHLTIDDTTNGPRRGFDQNRLSSTITRRITPVVAAELGYQWVAGRTSSGRRTDAHVILTTVQITP